MPQTKNKVKFGLENVVYAKATTIDNVTTWADPVRIPGAVNLSLDSDGEPENFYADNGVYYVINNNNGYGGDLEIAIVPESFLIDIMNQTKDENGVLIENADAELNEFALGFQFKGDKKKIRHWLYKCSASRTSISGATTESTKSVQTETLKISSTPLADGRVKAKTGDETSEAVYNSWFDKVYTGETTAETGPANAESDQTTGE